MEKLISKNHHIYKGDKMKLQTLFERVDYKIVSGNLEIPMSTLVYDSRKVEQDSVFVCISGAAFDGHKFVKEVVKAGATTIVVEKDVEIPEGVTVVKVENTRKALAELSAAYFGYPAEQLTTIGLTGTKGKTTITYMIRSVLEHAGQKTGLIGTIETIVGDEVIPSVNTTPESYVVQESFRKMVDAGCKNVVMEVSSQGLMLHRVSGFTFDYGVFTNLAKDHIGENEHKDMDDYIHCKSLLFQQCKQGIVNGDDAYVERILEGHTCSVETFGEKDTNDVYAANISRIQEPGYLGVSYDLKGKQEYQVHVDIPGDFTVYNSLAAISLCRHIGISKDDVLTALNVIQVKGRLEIVKTPGEYTLMIDYAHNAMSLESLLTTIRKYNPNKIYCLFGCGGNRSKDRRYEMGEVSSKLADLTVVTSDNPRNEEPMDIINDILIGVHKADGEYVTIPDRKEAIQYCMEHAGKGDIVILAGKGHEDYQEIKGVKHHMDERDLIQEIIEGR
jgi:UDP-N-acetylmuramoyl-L-alanyl-D-glutamate--2,6-diaminopimelate ligase